MDRLGKKKSKSQVKEEVSDSRKRKHRSKQYGNGHVCLNTSYFVQAGINSPNIKPQTSKRQWTAKTDHPVTSTNNTLHFRCGVVEIRGAY